MRGLPVGYAMQDFGLKFADLAIALAGEIDADHERERNAAHDADITMLWTGHNDVRSFVILGDPAVRLPVKPPILHKEFHHEPGKNCW